MKLTPEALSAIAATTSAIAALSALIFSGWQCVEMRRQRVETHRQNKMSVRPLLAFTRVVFNFEKHPVGVFITNSGLGPAMIKKVTVYDRKTKRVSFGDKALIEILVPLAQELNLLGEIQNFWLDEGSGIKAGDTVKILWVNHDSKHQQEIIRLMARINIKLDYESMYEEERTPIYLWDSEDFIWAKTP